MVKVKKLVLDVLKPHQPNAVSMATALADHLSGSVVCVKVVGVDEKTQDVVLSIAGDALDYESIEGFLAALGASVHSVDEVVAESGEADPSG